MNLPHIGQDSLILILMQMEPRTRTNFLRTTPIPGLKPKLRDFVSKLYPIDSQEKSLKTLFQLTQLVRHGGVPPKEILELNWNEAIGNFLFRQNEMQEIKAITDFLKLYFDCGFIYTPSLIPMIRKMDRNEFKLYRTIYEQVYKFDKEPRETFETLFVDSWTIGKHREEIIEEWIVYLNISPKDIAEYIWFDYQNFEMDTDIIFHYFSKILNDPSKNFVPFIEKVLKYPFDGHKDDAELNIYLSKFFVRLIQEALENANWRKLVERLDKYYYLMIDIFCSQVKYIENINYDDKVIEWLNERINQIVLERPKDIVTAYLIKNRPHLLNLLK